MDFDLRSNASSSASYDINFSRQRPQPPRQKPPSNQKSKATVPDYLMWQCTDCDEAMSVFYKDEHLRGKSHAKVLYARGMSRDSAIGEDFGDFAAGEAASGDSFGSGAGGFSNGSDLVDVLSHQPEVNQVPQHHLPDAKTVAQGCSSGSNIHNTLIDFSAAVPSSLPQLETFDCGTCSAKVPLADIVKHLSSAPKWECGFCHSWLHHDWKDQHLEQCLLTPSEAEYETMDIDTASMVADQSTEPAPADLPCENLAPISFGEWGVLARKKHIAQLPVDSEVLLDGVYDPGFGAPSTSGTYMSALEELFLPQYKGEENIVLGVEIDTPEILNTMSPDLTAVNFAAHQLDELFGCAQGEPSDEQAEPAFETEAELSLDTGAKLVPETEIELTLEYETQPSAEATPERGVFECSICSKTVPVEERKHHTPHAYECTVCQLTTHEGHYKNCHLSGKKHIKRVELRAQEALVNALVGGDEDNDDTYSKAPSEPESTPLESSLSPPVKTPESEPIIQSENVPVPQETRPTPQEDQNHSLQEIPGNRNQDLGQTSCEIPRTTNPSCLVNKEQDTFYCVVCSKHFPVVDHEDRAWTCYVCLETIHWSGKVPHLDEHKHRPVEDQFGYNYSLDEVLTSENGERPAETLNSYGMVSRKPGTSTAPSLLLEQPAVTSGPSIRDTFQLPSRPLSENSGDPWECKLCQRQMQLSSRDQHLAGSKHLEQVRLHTLEELRRQEVLRQAQAGPASMAWECQLCGRSMQMSSKESHLAGSSHREMEEKLRAAEEFRKRAQNYRHLANEDWECRICDRRMQASSIPYHVQGLGHSEKEKLRRQPQIRSENSDEWKCTICWKSIQYSLRGTHLMSSEHRDLGRLLGLTGVPQSDAEAPMYESIWECRICQRAMPHNLIKAHLTDPHHKQGQQRIRESQAIVQAAILPTHRSLPTTIPIRAPPTLANPNTFYCDMCRGTFPIKYQKMHEGGQWKCLVCNVYTHAAKQKEHEAGRKHQQALQQQRGY